MYSFILKNIISPIVQIKNPKIKSTMKNLHLLEKTQWLTSQELINFQQKRFQILINHAYENVPYYKKMFKQLNLKPQDIKNLTDLQKIPILTKDIIRDKLNELTAQNYSQTQLIPSYTGGTTATPISFYIDDQWNAWNTAAALREWGWAGYRSGDKIIYLWGSPADLQSQRQLKAKINFIVGRTTMLDAYNMNEKTLEEYVKIFKKKKPKIINAYPSAIYLMAEYLQKKGIDGISPKAILTSCEMLLDYQRKMIENTFNCEVFDYYSGRDTTLHAAECPEHTGYHLTIENAFVEFFKNNEPVSPGEYGEIIITDFSNYANPFIRYKIGDLGILSDETCPCGRGLPLMKKIVGRTVDMIVTKDGKYIPGFYFTRFFLTKAIKQFQIIQKTKDHFILKIVKGEMFSQEELNKIINKIREKCGDIEIDVEFADLIPFTNSGKYRYTISDVKIEF